MAYDPKRDFNAFVPQADYGKVFNWHNWNYSLNQANARPANGNIHRAHLLGYSGEELNNVNFESGRVGYNCIGWACGINKWVSTNGPTGVGNNHGPVMQNPASVRRWIDEIKQMHGVNVNDINPAISNEYDILPFRNDNNNDIGEIEIPYGVNRDPAEVANVWEDYTKREHDIGLYFQNNILTHAAVVFDIADVYNIGIDEQLWWTSKCGRNKLIAHSLRLLSPILNNVVSNRLNFGQGISNEFNYGDIRYILRKKEIYL